MPHCAFPASGADMANHSFRFVAVLGTVLCAAQTIGHAQDSDRRPAVPQDPVAAVINAFQSHDIVALGEGPHTNEQGHAFRLALIRDPRFATMVNDIVVESGSARYQDAMDRFVRGDDVAAETLRDIRENTVGAAPVWDRLMYDEFFQAVRDVNRSLPRERQLRILLGDPPIDWAAVRTPEDYRPWLRARDSHPAEVIRREVLAKGRRALVIYGDGHFQARSERPGRSLAAILESAGVRLFIITSTFASLATFQPDVDAWTVPAFTMLRGTLVGAAPYDVFFGPPPPVEYFRRNPRIEDHYDALLYLGRTPSMGRLSYPRCADPDYIRMRVSRMTLAGSPPTVADRLAQECAAAGRK